MQLKMAKIQQKTKSSILIKRALRRPFLQTLLEMTMMKTKLMSLAGLALLAGCSTNEQVADPSTAQTQAAEIAYNDLRDGKYEEFLSYLDPKLQQYFQENQKTMKKFSHSIPEGEYKSKTLRWVTCRASWGPSPRRSRRRCSARSRSCRMHRRWR